MKMHMSVDAIDTGLEKKLSVCCVIPCYNVASLCGDVVYDTSLYADQVIAVNDGSTDETADVLQEVASRSQGRIRVLSFPKNLGKGTALLKGFRYALEKLSFDLLITLDADRQHRPEDIPRLVTASREENAAFVIGERTAGSESIPFRSRIGNNLATWLVRRYYPDGPRDTQSGFRAFRRDFVKEIVRHVEGGRYETELFILLLALERRERIARVPIEIIYLDRNSSSHFRPFSDALRIYRALLRFRRRAQRKAFSVPR